MVSVTVLTEEQVLPKKPVNKNKWLKQKKNKSNGNYTM